MVYRDLRDFLEDLEARGLLTKINDELSPILEIPTLLMYFMKRELGAVMIERVKGYPRWRVVGNIFGGWRYIKLLFGEKPEEIGIKLIESLSSPYSEGILSRISRFKDIVELGKYLPRVVKYSPLRENIFEGVDVDLDSIPIFKTWPKDAGRFITYPLVITRDPEFNIYNIGVYRMQVLSKNEAIIHWQIHKRGAVSERIYKERGGDKIPVAVAIGGDPYLLFTGAAPVPRGIDEYLFAGILRGHGVEVFRSDLTSLYIPAYAELVLEGYVDPNDYRLEGPFGDHMGYYTPPDYYPVFKVERILIREDPIYYGTIVGKPPMEDGYIGKAIERIFLPFIRMLMPEVVDINLPIHGLFQGMAIVSIKKRYPWHAKKVMMGLWGLGQFSLTKIIIIVDADVNVHDINQVIYAISSTVDPQRDVVVIPYTHTDALDHTTSTPLMGSKLGIDATRKLKEECLRGWPEEVKLDPDVDEKVRNILKKMGL